MRAATACHKQKLQENKRRTQQGRIGKGGMGVGGGKDTGHWDNGTAGPKAIVHFVNGN